MPSILHYNSYRISVDMPRPHSLLPTSTSMLNDISLPNEAMKSEPHQATTILTTMQLLPPHKKLMLHTKMQRWIIKAIWSTINLKFRKICLGLQLPFHEQKKGLILLMERPLLQLRFPLAEGGSQLNRFPTVPHLSSTARKASSSSTSRCLMN